MPTTLVRTTIALLAATSLVAGCGSSNQPRPTAAAADTVVTTVASKTAAAPYAQAGPYDVGFTTLHLDDGRPVLVWYPAAKGHHPEGDQEVIRPWESLSADRLAKVPTNEWKDYLVDAYEDAPAAQLDRPAPIVVSSHGYSGQPEDAVSLTTHLASWGFVVAAPEHVERSLGGLWGTAAAGIAPRSDVDVLGETVDRVEAAGEAAGALQGLVDPSHVSAIGFSAGASSAFRFASDDRVDGWISYGLRFGGPLGPQPPSPDKPGMVMMAEEDQAVPNLFTKSAYAAMNGPKYLVRVYDAGHQVFGDACLTGGPDHPFSQVARTYDLLPDWLTDVAGDGCQADLPPVTGAWPAINQATVAFLRWVSDIDQRPVGLDTPAVTHLGTPTTITHD